METRSPQQDSVKTKNDKAMAADIQEAERKRLLETKRKMLDAIGNSKMGGVFEGTAPLKTGGAPGNASTHSPVANRDPNDAGVDISGLFNVAGQKWNALK